MGGNLETVFSLPGAGDLYVTSQGGRNTRLAHLLGKGLPYSVAVEEMPGETIEGIDALLVVGPAVERMIELGKIEADALPLLRKLYRIITRAEPVHFDFDDFFGRLSYMTGSHDNPK
jgi:glycerol-3-phosphate dehydrogenase (NAD(P)+)